MTSDTIRISGILRSSKETELLPKLGLFRNCTVTVEATDLVLTGYSRQKPRQGIHALKPINLSPRRLTKLLKGETYSAPFWDKPLEEKFGITGSYWHATMRVFSAPLDKLEQLLEEETIPLLRKFECQNCVPVICKPRHDYQRIRAIRLLFLINRDGIETTLTNYRFGASEITPFGQQPSDYSSAIDSLIPDPMDFFEWVNTLSRYSPVLPSLPVTKIADKQSVCWHFVPENWSDHLNLISTSFFDSSYFSSDVFRDDQCLPIRKNFTSVKNTHELLVLASSIVDRLISDTASIDFWADQNGNVKPEQMMTGFSSIRFLFSDLGALVRSGEFHERIVWATGVIDKLSNLVLAITKSKSLGGTNVTEDGLAKMLASKGVARWAFKTLEEKTKQLKLHSVREELCMSIKDYHLDMMRDLGNLGDSEEERLSRLRSFRNLRHGTFLHKDQFKKIFLTTQFNNPPPRSLPAYSWLLAMAVLCNLEGFVLDLANGEIL